MSSNGHSPDSLAQSRGAVAALPSALPQKSSEDAKRLIADLEVPFEASRIELRVINTSQDKMRGQVIPYADQRAYTDRLNALFTPGGWTRRYAIHTSANFERSKDQKIAAKVLVTCEVTIFSLGTHSATGEEWTDNDNAGTAAEAQAFKRACSCFGLGRYLYHYERVWVDLDERKRPKSIPQLASWATPTAWAQGLRPNSSSQSKRGETCESMRAVCAECPGFRDRGDGGTPRPRALPWTAA